MLPGRRRECDGQSRVERAELREAQPRRRRGCLRFRGADRARDSRGLDGERRGARHDQHPAERRKLQAFRSLPDSFAEPGRAH